MKFYLELNHLLLLSYLFFTIVRRGFSLLQIQATHQSLVRCAQVLVLISLLAPVAFHQIPSEKLPVFDFSNFYPPQENDFSANMRQFTPSSDKSSAVTVKKDHQLKNEAAEWTVRDFYESENFSTHLIAFWFLGLGFFLFRFAKNLQELHRILSRSVLLKKYQKVRVAVSDSVNVPFSARLFKKSWVILPVKIFENKKDLKIAIKHEFQHHKQGDTLWAFAMEVLSCFFYANPAIYYWKKEITELQEFSCDEAITGQGSVSAHEYGSCLMRVAEAALESRKMVVGTASMSATFKNPNYLKSFLRRRIEMIAQSKKPAKQKWAGLIIGTLVLLSTVAIGYSSETSFRKKENLPNPGTVIVDDEIQSITEKALAEAIMKERASSGFAIVADPKTGRILAIANIDSKNKKKGQWALSQLMEPASLSKTFVVAQAIEKGLITPQEKQNCEKSNYKYGDRVYHDWKEVGWDQLTAEDTIAVSSDICTMKIAEKIGADELKKMLINFGFGPDGTAKSFQAAKSGSLPPKDDPKNPRLVPYISAGFGFKASPLEILQAYGAIANGGNLMEPKSSRDPNVEGKVIRRVLSEESAKKVREILQQVVLKGTAAKHGSDLYTTAGKTATAYSADLMQIDWMGGKKLADLAGFVGFAPVTNPQVEVYVGIQDPEDKTGAHGSVHAAPVFKLIIEGVLKHMKVAPDKPQV